jgi:hypothetical protein
MADCKFCVGKERNGEFSEPLIQVAKGKLTYYVGAVAKGNPYLFFEVEDEDLNQICGEEVSINYCPMCGRNLKEESKCQFFRIMK